MLLVTISPKDFEQVIDRALEKHEPWDYKNVKGLILNSTYHWREDIGEEVPWISCSIYALLGDICGAIKYSDEEGITYANILEELYNQLQPFTEINHYI